MFWFINTIIIVAFVALGYTVVEHSKKEHAHWKAYAVQNDCTITESTQDTVVLGNAANGTLTVGTASGQDRWVCKGNGKIFWRTR